MIDALSWRGLTVAVLCSGPSMNQAGADAVRHLPTIAVNTTFQLAPWASVLYAADAAWWAMTPRALEFAGLKVTMEEVRGVRRLQRAGSVGYTDDATMLHTFGHSGAQAIQIAAKAGATRILVLGMDMTGGHWHGEHPHPLRTTHQDTYGVWRDRMPVLAEALAARGVEVINCSPASALECWPRMSIGEALAGAVPAV